MIFSKEFDSATQYYHSGQTRSYAFRLNALEKFENMLLKNEENICRALYQDLRKSKQESVMSEFAVLIEEIRYAKKKLKKWMQPDKVGSTLLLLPSVNRVHYEPKGVALVLGPWNYPVYLLLAPLVGAIAAGNCAILKPSELAPATSVLILEMFNETFPSDYIRAVEGGVPETTELLKYKWGHIFFTGSTPVGKIVMEAASKNLSPVTLELGGKSPVVVCEDANLDLAARRIVWGKFYNAGQTCVAPDYLYVHQSKKEIFINKIKAEITKQFGTNPKSSDGLSRIINKKNHKRLMAMIDEEKVVAGGTSDEKSLYISPTVMEDVSWDDAVMSEEIFGPILPVLSYENFDHLLDFLKVKPKPLAAYLFTNSSKKQKTFVQKYSFGGGAINDVIVHLPNHYLPFGGVGDSGMGSYHGKHSFLTFSHHKSVMKRFSFLDFSARYAPYSQNKLKFLRRMIGL